MNQPEVQQPVDQLAEYGTVLTSPEGLAQCHRAFGRDEQVAAILRTIESGTPRSVLLTGSPGAGKTALVHELAHRLAEQGWHLLQMRSSDFLVGTMYLGQWETRLNSLLALCRQPAKVVIYVPDFDSLPTVGKASNTTTNVGQMLRPEIASGAIAVIGESNADPEVPKTGSSLHRALSTVPVVPMSAADTVCLMERIAASNDVRLADGCAARILELTEYYGSDKELPGRAVDLLRRGIEQLPGGRDLLESGHVLRALGAATGLPMSMLDDQEHLDRRTVREFFDQRVMGQVEAIDAAVDLVMMVKAGLSDPARPLAVLMFLGPTGVGKTELARALAEFCFGDATRMNRIDMSEYASPDSYPRLLGNREHPGALTGPVRENPFSIILLDEFEKASYPVFDLCLQLFDAGRLTDLDHRTADFRRSMIILTSNLGARMPVSRALGFHEQKKSPEDATATRRRNADHELHRVFRPEFLNRIDRIIHFQPLSKATVAEIASREIGRALDRSGLRRRRINVQLDPSVLPLLLERGYSESFGARPMKRTIEQLLLAPLASVIATGKAPGGSTVLVERKGQHLRPRILRVDPPSDPPIPSHRAGRGAPLPDQTGTLQEAAERLIPVCEVLRQRRTALMLELNTGASGDDAARRSAIQDSVYRLDAVERRCQTFLAGLQQFVHPAAGDSPDPLAGNMRRRELFEQLALQARWLGKIAAAPEDGSTDEVILSLRLLDSQDGSLRSVELVGRMYREFLQRMEFLVTVLEDQRSQTPRMDAAIFHVSGPGALLLLGGERGLHVLTRNLRKGNVLESVRVEVLAVPQFDETALAGATRFETRPHKRRRTRFGQSVMTATAFHAESMISVHAALETDGDEAKRLMLGWLAARIEAQSRGSSRTDDDTSTAVRRTYRLGPKGQVRDQVTKIRTRDSDRVLAGQIDRFLLRDSTGHGQVHDPAIGTAG